MSYQDIRIEDFNYTLPDVQVAKYPLPDRDECRLLVANEGHLSDHIFRDLPSLLPEKGLLVMNDTRVIRARLEFFRETGARIEVFCLEPSTPALYELSLSSREPVVWHCLVGNARKWREPTLSKLLPSGTCLVAERCEEGEVRFSWDSDRTFGEVLTEAGELPIPPYLHRETEESDLETYQTVYAEHEGSVAAPTAGLHFTDRVLGELQSRGLEVAKLTLHVGAGTFLHVKSETMGGHTMHKEMISVPVATLERLLLQVERGEPIIAVGTTTTRTLESLYYMGHQLLEGVAHPFEVPQWLPYTLTPRFSLEETLRALIEKLHGEGEQHLVGRTQLVILPSFEYKMVDYLITNFHQPMSTLLLLVAAFMGDPEWRRMYQHALDGGYRFLSYGDATLLHKKVR
ncbi:MAG: S-adenosylmethionine:tRNA ribosyltransferase-isomerase [Porphyromonas sp.]|nr:S-adenosylmethionine:tRNA ribosyltransferase-isomerase [Porphyromonas sp.]